MSEDFQHPFKPVLIFLPYNNSRLVVLGGIMDISLPLTPRFEASNSAEGDTNSQHNFLRRKSEAVDPMSKYFTACYRFLRSMKKDTF
jgi:uncharacterized protein (UPF0303 family)